MLEFYRSDTGRKTLEQLPLLVAQGAQLAMRRVQAHLPEAADKRIDADARKAPARATNDSCSQRLLPIQGPGFPVGEASQKPNSSVDFYRLLGNRSRERPSFNAGEGAAMVSLRRIGVLSFSCRACGFLGIERIGGRATGPRALAQPAFSVSRDPPGSEQRLSQSDWRRVRPLRLLLQHLPLHCPVLGRVRRRALEVHAPDLQLDVPL